MDYNIIAVTVTKFRHCIYRTGTGSVSYRTMAFEITMLGELMPFGVGK